jgi:hypothetical protein
MTISPVNVSGLDSLPTTGGEPTNTCEAPGLYGKNKLEDMLQVSFPEIQFKDKQRNRHKVSLHIICQLIVQVSRSHANMCHIRR